MATAERVARVEGVEGVASVERVERVPLAVPMRSGCHAGGSSPATVGGGGCNHRWRISLPAYSCLLTQLLLTLSPASPLATYVPRRYPLTTALPTYYGATYLLRRATHLLRRYLLTTAVPPSRQTRSRQMGGARGDQLHSSRSTGTRAPACHRWLRFRFRVSEAEG